MTVTINLPSDLEASLVAQARAHGLDLPQYVEHLLREQVPVQAGSALSPAERATAWRESTAKAYMAIGVDEHPGRHQYTAAANPA